jgi:hypothetical protein
MNLPTYLLCFYDLDLEVAHRAQKIFHPGVELEEVAVGKHSG